MGRINAARNAASVRRAVSASLNLASSWGLVMIDKSKSVAFSDEFIWHYGAFHASWISGEALLCYMIGSLLKISHTETHIITAGMEFGRKAAIARNLAYLSKHPKKKEVIGLIGRLQNESKRNVFAHGLMVNNNETVTFLDRSRGGDYDVTAYSFSLKEFVLHVQSVAKIGADLHRAFGADEADLEAFHQAALSIANKSATSPTRPSSKA